MRSSRVVGAAAIILVSGVLAAAQLRDHPATAPATAPDTASATAATAAATATALPASNPPTVSIQFDGSRFAVTGWRAPANAPPGGWPAVLAVYASAAGAADGPAGSSAPGATDATDAAGLPAGLPPLLGSYAVEQGGLVFRPRFPLAAGLEYHVVFAPPGGRQVRRTFYGPPRDVTPATRVLHIYPSAAVLPSNTLRLYIYFSAPMSRGEAAAYVHVRDEHGRVLQGVFLPGEELWDPKFERLTLTFDPGRIKRGLTSNERMGPPIAPGAHYTLLVDRAWPDARGAPLVAGASKAYQGGPALRMPPDPRQWAVLAPVAGRSAPLTIRFPTPMNYPLLQRMLRVVGPDGSVSGRASIEGDETRWRFTPRVPWRAGRYQLIVDRDLEDVAGNHIGQLFDIDQFHRVTAHIVTRTLAVPFTVH